MSLTQTIPYTLGSNFNYDPAFIEFPGTLARLKKQIQALTYSQHFTSSTGFTFDPNKTEFVGTVMQQKNTRPASAVVYADWTAQLNADWGTGGLGVTPNGGAAIAAGVLNLIGSGKWVSLGNPGYSPVQVGTVAFNFIPNYNGNPGVAQTIYMSTEVTNGAKSYLTIRHELTGQLSVQIYSTTSGLIFDGNVGAFVAVAGQAAQIVLQVDVNAGASKLFVNGAQLGATITGTGTRNGAGALYIGSDRLGNTTGQNFSIRNLAIYNTVVAPATATPLSVTRYDADAVTLPLFSYTGIAPMLGYTGFSANDTNAPHYTFNGLWFNGAGWVTSNGTYAQANTAAVAGTNIATLPASASLSIQVVTQSSDTQQSVDSLLVSYNGQIYTTADQSVDVASGVLTDTLVALSAIFDAPTNTQLGFFLEVAGVKLYWNGSIWAISDETIAKTNDLATINANLGSLVLTFGKTVKLGVVLKSVNGLVTPTITSAEVDYNFRAPGPTDPATCTVWAQLYDLTGEEVASGATLTAELSESFEFGERVVGASKVTVPFDATGYAAVLLTQSVTAGKTYSFKINWTDPSGKARTINFVDAVVPAQDAIRLMDLTSPQ